MSSIPPSGTGNDTLALLTAHLGSTETQVLCNVAVALGVLGTPQSAVHLADLAVLQPDPAVRDRALAALEGAPRDAKQAAAERARELLIESLEKRDDKGRERSSVSGDDQIGYANDVLVALRYETTVTLPERPLPDWLGWLRTWRGLGLLIGYFSVFWKLREHLFARQPRQSFWLAFAPALLPAMAGFGVSIAILGCWHPLFFTDSVILGAGVPTVLIAAGLAVLYRDSVVSGSRYYNRRIGAWIETLGLFVRPGISLWYRLAFPLAVAVVGVLALAPMLLGFEDLGLGAFDHLLWFLIATAFLWIAFAVTRFVVARTSAGWGVAVLLLFGLVIPGLIFLRWPQPKIAIFCGECVLLFPALAAVVLIERWKKSESRLRNLWGAVAWFLVAVLIVLTPGLLRLREAGTEKLRSWRLAHVPIERGFHVDESSWVCARVKAEDTGCKFDLRLRFDGQIVEGREALSSKSWPACKPGDYTLEATAGNLRVKPSRFSFVVAEGYATAVAFMARELLVLKGETPPASMPGAYTLELVTQAESCPAATPPPQPCSPDVRAETSRAR